MEMKETSHHSVRLVATTNHTIDGATCSRGLDAALWIPSPPCTSRVVLPVYNQLNVNEFTSAAGPPMIVCHKVDLPLMERTRRAEGSGGGAAQRTAWRSSGPRLLITQLVRAELCLAAT